jgi:hypothetical protein
MASCQACSATRQPNGEDLLECAGGCNAVYCSKICQEKDWESHKLECKAYQSHTCWICNQTGQTGDPVYRSCACRGDKGFGHLRCFVDYAKERPKAYKSCHVCKINYGGEIQRVLAEEMNQEATTVEEELLAKSYLARSHGESGNLEASYKCLKEIIETTLRVRGEDHAFTSGLLLDAMFSLATIATKSGHQEEAFGWLNCVQRDVLNGPIERFQHKLEGSIEHSFLEFKLVDTLAIVYMNIGQLDMALPFA